MLHENVPLKEIKTPNISFYFFLKKYSFAYVVLYFEDTLLTNVLRVISTVKEDRKLVSVWNTEWLAHFYTSEAKSSSTDQPTLTHTLAITKRHQATGATYREIRKIFYFYPIFWEALLLQYYKVLEK